VFANGLDSFNRWQLGKERALVPTAQAHQGLALEGGVQDPRGFVNGISFRHNP